MRLALIFYITVYYVVVATAVATLWQSGLIEHLPRGWTLAIIGASLVPGMILFLASRK